MEKPTYDKFVGYLRSALNYLYDPVHLRRSPLVDLLGLTGEFDKAAALQRILTEAIQALKPAVDEPPQSSTWGIYDALNLQYIRQFTRETVATQLGFSERQLRREHRLALEALAQNLYQNPELNFLPTIGQPTEAPAPPEYEKTHALSTELGWLKNPEMEQRIPLGELLQTVYDLAQPLAQKMQVPLRINVSSNLAEIPVIQMAIRNILLTVLNEVIPITELGQVIISAVHKEQSIEIKVASSNSRIGQTKINRKDEAVMETAQRLASFYGANLFVEQQDSLLTVSLTFRVPEQIPVLVIDDNADWLDMLKRYTVGSPYNVTGTREPENASSLAERIQPAVIFLDVMMPNIDGWQILSELRHSQATSHIPIVVCTVLPLEELALSLGVNAFLQKPVTQDQFLNILKKMIINSGEVSPQPPSPP